MNPAHRKRIVETLFRADPDRGKFRVYALLDGARDPRVGRIIFRNPGGFCRLETAPLKPEVREAAPSLVLLRERDPVVQDLLQGGWGRSWGLFAVAPGKYALETLREHFHGLLRVQDEDGRVMLFRYYDPRVLRVFLPTCSPEQLKIFFGPIQEYWVEDEAAEALLRFTFDGRQLIRTRSAIADERDQSGMRGTITKSGS
jgi:hypothetical protein